MSISENLSRVRDYVITQAGIPIRLRYFTGSFTGSPSPYDDDLTWYKSGNDLWTSGIVLPVNSATGTEDSLLLEQGKLLYNDMRLYTNGSLVFTGSLMEIKIQVGSPTGNQYSIIPVGVTQAEVEGVGIYKRTYIRRITTGSIFGE